MSILFGGREERSISYQDLFGRAADLNERRSQVTRYSAADAMSLSAVAACVELRANYVAQLPFDAYREGPGGTSVKVSPQPAVVVRPSAKGIPRSAWMKQAQYARLLWGNATLMVGSRDAAGYPKSLDVLPPWDVTFDRTSILERLEVRLGGQPVDTSDLLIIPGQVRPGSTVGVAPLAASGLVELGRRAQDFGREWFRNGAVPSSIIYADKELTGEQADGIVDTIQRKWRRRKPAVLGSGLRYEKVSVPANESQFLETIRQNQAEIAIVLGIAPSAIGVSVSGQSVTYSNREQDAQQVMLNTVNNDILLWQEILFDVVPRPQFIRFSTGAFLRTDLKTRYESYALGISNGFLEANEARAWEDLGPITVTTPEPAPPAPNDALEELRSMLTRQSVQGVAPAQTHIHLPDSLSVEMRQDPIVVPAPVVNVPPAQVTVNVDPTPVTVNVEAPVVNVEPPTVNVEVIVPDDESDDSDRVEMIQFTRDAQGQIIGAVKGVG